MSEVWITLGDRTCLGIAKHNGLQVKLDAWRSFPEIRLGLGPATKKRIEELQSYLERLKIHCE